MKTFQSQISDADLRILRIYKTVVECGGFSAAEVVLNISRAAISIAISDLETRLGFRLCQRGRSGFSLTNEGSQVYEHTLQLLSSIEDFRTHINALHQHLKGELNIVGWQGKGRVQKDIENKVMRFLKTKLERNEAKAKAKEMVDVLIKNKDA